jgi:hypothetical protein
MSDVFPWPCEMGEVHGKGEGDRACIMFNGSPERFPEPGAV